MRDIELKPDRIVLVETCAICGGEISRRDPKAWIGAHYKGSGAVVASAHADCVRPFLSDRAKSLLDPEKVASDADRSDT